jgi:hypothetical protein
MKMLQQVSRSLITVLLIGSLVTLQGCFNHIPHNIPPEPPSEEVRKQLRLVKVEPIEVKPDHLDTVYEKLKRGAPIGSPPPILAPIFLGAAIAVLAGVAANELLTGGTERDTARMEAEAIQKTLEQAPSALKRSLIEDILQNARESAGQQLLGPNYEARTGADSIVKIDQLEFGLLETSGFIPLFTSYAAMRLRVVDATTTGTLYLDHVEHLGRTMNPHAWGTNDAEQLRSELSLVSRQLAEKIVDTLFLRYRLKEPRTN